MLELISALLGALIISAAAIVGYRGAVASLKKTTDQADSVEQKPQADSVEQSPQADSTEQKPQADSAGQKSQDDGSEQTHQTGRTEQPMIAQPTRKAESAADGKRTSLGLPVSMIVLTILTCAVWIASSFLHGYELWRLIFNLCLSVFMTVLAAIDLEYKRVPNRVLLVMLAVYVFAAGIYIVTDIANGLAFVFASAAGSLFAGISFLLCYIISRRQLGGGDVKLAFLLGLYLGGGRIFGAIIYGILCCFVYSIVQLCRRRLGLRDGVPLVPFLYLGVLITFLITG